VSSKSGAADVLECLGVNIRMDAQQAEDCLKQTGVVFLFAPTHHPAMRFAAPVRQALKLRTIFNLLGPLANPGLVQHHLLGVFSPVWLRPMAETLLRLGSSSAWVVYGADGLDELSTTGPNRVAALKHGRIDEFEVDPSDAGLPHASLGDLLGGTPQENADAISALLDGKTGAFRDIVLLNTAAALVVAGRADSLVSGVEQAAHSIDTGAARDRLSALVAASQRVDAAVAAGA
jgi:anthranilate phosphoribosyltransferase